MGCAPPRTSIDDVSNDVLAMILTEVLRAACFSPSRHSQSCIPPMCVPVASGNLEAAPLVWCTLAAVCARWRSLVGQGGLLPTWAHPSNNEGSGTFTVAKACVRLDFVATIVQWDAWMNAFFSSKEPGVIPFPSLAVQALLANTPMLNPTSLTYALRELKYVYGDDPRVAGVWERVGAVLVLFCVDVNQGPGRCRGCASRVITRLAAVLGPTLPVAVVTQWACTHDSIERKALGLLAILQSGALLAPWPKGSVNWAPLFGSSGDPLGPDVTNELVRHPNAASVLAASYLQSIFQVDPVRGLAAARVAVAVELVCADAKRQDRRRFRLTGKNGASSLTTVCDRLHDAMRTSFAGYDAGRHVLFDSTSSGSGSGSEGGGGE